MLDGSAKAGVRLSIALLLGCGPQGTLTGDSHLDRCCASWREMEIE